MLIPIAVLHRDSASEPAVETTIAVDPFEVARVEESEEHGIINWWANGMDGPRKTRMSVVEFATLINSFCCGDEECLPADSDTE